MPPSDEKPEDVKSFFYPTWVMKRVLPLSAWAANNKLLVTVAVSAGFKLLSKTVVFGVTRLGWEDEWLIQTVAACSVGLVHSGLTVPLAFEALKKMGWSWFKQRDSFDIACPPSNLGTLASLISNAYFIYDFSYIIPYESDPLIHFHHLGSVLYLTSTLMSGRGEPASLLCILIGEGTNPATNVYNIAKAMTDKGVFTGVQLRHYLGALNIATLLFARACYAPYMLAWKPLEHLFLRKRGAVHVHFALRAFWLALPTFFICGTFLYLHSELSSLRVAMSS